MKVLMLKDVSGIGNRGQVKEVKQGYAINYLIPNKLAVAADMKVVNNFNAVLQAKKDREIVHEELAKKTISEIKGKSVTVKAKSSEKGHLFKAVHAEEIAKAFASQNQIQIDATWLPKGFSIKEVGQSDVTLKKFGMKADIKIYIEAE